MKTIGLRIKTQTKKDEKEKTSKTQTKKDEKDAEVQE